MMRAMNKRILVIIGVFVAGFAIGWGVTSLVVTGAGPAQVATNPPAAPPDAAVAAADVEPDAVGSSALAAAVEADVAGASAAPAAGDAEEAPPDAGPSDAAPDPSPAPDGGPADAAAPPEPAAAAPDAAVAAAPPARDEPWWEACRDKRCRVDFGRVTGGVSIRRASLEHGATVDWRRDFDGKKKVGVLSSGSDVWVTVHGVGMTDGKPSAASITWKGGGETLTGVIALSIGDKQIKFVPSAP